MFACSLLIVSFGLSGCEKCDPNPNVNVGVGVGSGGVSGGVSVGRSCGPVNISVGGGRWHVPY